MLVLLGACVLRRSSRASNSAGLKVLSPVRYLERHGIEGRSGKSGSSVRQSESSDPLSNCVLALETVAKCLSLGLAFFKGGVQGGDTKSMGERGARASKGNVMALKIGSPLFIDC